MVLPDDVDTMRAASRGISRAMGQADETEVSGAVPDE
jgi:hypothetical protein